jgi:hypothetical protein
MYIDDVERNICRVMDKKFKELHESYSNYSTWWWLIAIPANIPKGTLIKLNPKLLK